MTIDIKPSRKGLLHKKLGVPQGEKILAAKLAKAKASSSPALRKEATFATNAKSFHHAGSKTPASKKQPVTDKRGRSAAFRKQRETD